MPTPNIVKGQIAIDPYKGIFYYRNNANTLVNTSLNWSQPTDSLIQTEDSVQINSDISVSGNLTINGNTTTLNTETLTVEDNIIILNSGVTGSPSLNAGVEVERGTSNNVVIRWNEGIDKWQFTNDGINYYEIGSVENASLDQLIDVNVSSAANGDFLRYNGNTWVNDPINLGSDTDGNYVASLVAGTGVFLANNSGETSTPTVSIGQDVSSSANVTFHTVTANFVGNVTGTVSSISTHNIDELADVVITTAKNGQFLQYNGSAWVNNVFPSAEPIGHEDKSQSTISFNEGSREFSIAPTSGSYVVWCKGVRYVKTTTETITIPSTSGLYYIYFSNTGSLSYKTTYFDWENDTPTAYIYWNQNDGKAYFFADERHGVTLDWATHEYLHRTRGAVIASGFGANGYTTTGDGSIDAHAVVSIADGIFFDEDLQVDITHSATPTANTWQQRLQANAYIPIFYHSNTHWKKDTATQFPMKQGTARVQYNLNTAGVWSTADIGNSKWGITWVVATNNLNEPVLGILGQSEYNAIGDAEAAVWEDLNLDGFPIFEFRPLYKIIYQTGGYANTPHARIQGVIDLRRVTSSGQGIPTTPVSDHGSMTGLADNDHPQYLLVADHDTRDHSNALSTASINDLSDVSISTVNDGDFLRWNGATWINDAVNLGVDTDGNYVESLVAGNNIVLSNEIGLGSLSPEIAVSATPSFTSVSTTNLSIDGIEIDPTGANSNVQVLRFDTLTNKFIPGLASTVAALADLTDVSNTAPVIGDFLYWDGTQWAPSIPATGVPTVSDTAPVSPTLGQLWFNSSSARTFIYYDSQWVEVGTVATNPDSVVSKVSQVIGNGASSYSVVHNLNTRNVLVEIYDNSTYETVTTSIARTTLDSITVSFAAPVSANAYTVVVIG